MGRGARRKARRGEGRRVRALGWRVASRAWYWFLNTLLRVVLWPGARIVVEHAERVPREGAVVLVCNHITNIDPTLVCAIAPRRLTPMAKRELFDQRRVGWAFPLYGAFPVRRFSADIGALRTARDLLRDGHAVLVFPEGTRSGGAMRPALPGSAMIALLGGAPVLPVAITGTEALLGWRRRLKALFGPRRTIRIVFGEPFELGDGAPTSDRVEPATDLIMRHVAALLPERYRGAYGAETEGQVVVARQSERERV